MKVLRTLILFISLMLSWNFAFADCNTLVSSNGTIVFQPPAVITVPFNASVGTFLYKVTTTATVTGQVNNCSGTYTTDNDMLIGSDTGLKTTEGCNIYSTNVKGVGYALTYGEWWPGGTMGCGRAGFPGKGYTTAGIILWNYYSAALVVTGPVDAGQLSTGHYGKVTVSAGQNFSGTVMGYIDIGTTAITSSGCDLDSRDIQVRFGDIPASKFTGVGPTAETKSFDIALTCPANANISVALDGVQNADTSVPGVLALTNANGTGVATGLGVQILYQNTPLAFNSGIVLKTVNRNVKETFPFTARYYQTKGMVTPGDANATATLNISYQ